ncbi:Protein kinase domain-containing protein [Fusarium sp. Ph1]|nr:Protein kinase domain-containing protein [Fusarium sp. Ph1]
MTQESDTNIWDSRFDDDTPTTPIEVAGPVSRVNAKARKNETTTEESSSDIWGSRFSDGDRKAAVEVAGSVSRASAEAGDLLRDIMMIVRDGLPNIPHTSLRFDSDLGRGTSFEVSKEVYTNLGGEDPYFVAVKRLVMRRDNGAPEESARELRAEARRLANLRFHPCLIWAKGWGLTPNTGDSKWPYLVMDYSAAGTLSQFAQARSINLIERRFLALDVAMGIRALHDCNIVHGDVKPDNVLVYGYSKRKEEHERSFLAKVADFGSTLFPEDLEREYVVYLGTPKYNAPEIRGLHRDQAGDKGDELIPLFNQFKAADCYSFGLLLWETVSRGESFIEKETKNPIEALESMFREKENAILEMAVDFFKTWQTQMEILEKKEPPGVDPGNPTRLQVQSLLYERRSHLDPIDAPADPDSLEALKNTVSLCLQDSMWKRGNMHQIVEALADGVSDALPQAGVSTVRTLPRRRNIRGAIPYDSKTYEKIRTLHFDESALARIIRVKKLPGLSAMPMGTPPDPSRQIVRAPPPKRVGTLVLTPQTHCYRSEDMFRASIDRQPPWENQCEAFKFLQHAIKTEKDEERRAQAYLQLAIMYLIGYGVADDSSKALRHLELASKHNEVARAIYGRVRSALEPDQEHEADDEPTHITYRNPDMFLEGIIERSGKADEEYLTLGPIYIQSFQVLSRLVKKGMKYKPHELSDAFTDACRDGHLDAAMLLAQYCTDISTIDKTKPNPFHWLIMFSPEEAIKIFKTAVSSPTNETDKKSHLEAIRSLLDAEHDDTVLLPHRCLELRGTPLHWAIMAGYKGLVEAFLSHGADVNRRNAPRRTEHQDGWKVDHPCLSPLDVAGACHSPQMVQLLLSHGAKVHGGDFTWSFSPLHMLGFHTVPFARYMHHGKHYRTALRETIKILRDAGVDINGLDSAGQTPLSIAAFNMDLEPYILEELLSVGATAGTMVDETNGNIVILAVMCCVYRRFSGWKIPHLLPLVRDINSFKSGPTSLNALHYCAFLDAAPAADALLRWPQTDIGAVSASGNSTAMSLAGERGSLEVLTLLIDKGADIDKGDAMENAVYHGHIEAVKLLLDAGAGIHFARDSGNTSNILEEAISRSSRRPSYVGKCLALCPQLREPDVLNHQDKRKLTALHWAVFYGDVEGVRALLNAGADPMKISGLDETPLELAALLLEEFTHPRSQAYVRESHSRVIKDMSELNKEADDYRARLTRIEMNVMDGLREMMGLLREAELERYPGGSYSRPERRIFRKPRVRPVDPEVPSGPGKWF